MARPRTSPISRWEVHADGRSALCDNFRITTLPGGKKLRGINQDKGQQHAIEACCRALKEGSGPVLPIHQLLGASLACLATIESLATAARVPIVPYATRSETEASAP